MNESIRKIKNYIDENKLNEKEHKLIIPITMALELSNVKTSHIMGFKYGLQLWDDEIKHESIKG